MALTDSATLNISTGHFYTATVATAVPTDPLVPGVGWTEIGHTSLDDIFNLASEGGDTTTLGTLQSKSLRTSTSPRTETFTFNLAQFDPASLKLYYGSNMVVESSGVADTYYGVPDAPTPTQVAFFACFIDGAATFSFYAPKAEVIRADDLSLSDTSSLALLPIKVTPLNHSGASKKYYVNFDDGV